MDQSVPINVGPKAYKWSDQFTLDEHRRVITHLRQLGARVKNPFSPGDLADWSTRNPERTVIVGQKRTVYPGRPKNMGDLDKVRLLKKVEALLAEAHRPWEYVHGMARRMFTIERVQWCEAFQLYFSRS